MDGITAPVVTNIPGGQPALTPSPLEDAFKVLAGYVGGQAQARMLKEKEAEDHLKMWVDSGAVDVDLSGGLTAPKYIPRPLSERPAYMEAKAKTGYYASEEAKNLSEAELNKVMVQQQQSMLAKADKGGLGAAKMKFLEFAKKQGLTFKQKASNSVTRQQIKDALVKQGIQGAVADEWITEAQKNG